MKFDIEENIFYYKKGSDLYFSEKYRLVFICRNFLDLYLIKIQSVLICRKISDLYLMKIEISFVCRKILDLYLMKIQIRFFLYKKISDLY